MYTFNPLSQDHLIFNMGIPIPQKMAFILRQDPGAKAGIFWES